MGHHYLFFLITAAVRQQLEPGFLLFGPFSEASTRNTVDVITLLHRCHLSDIIGYIRYRICIWLGLAPSYDQKCTTTIGQML
jgi:hypothetical protein